MHSELEEVSALAQSVKVAGDLNIHHSRRLQVSKGNTESGTKLQELCGQHGLRQLVDRPTREQYLLDLVMSDSGDIKCSVLHI